MKNDHLNLTNSKSKEKRFTGLKHWLDEHFGQGGLAFYAMLGCLLVMVLIGLTAILLHLPMLSSNLGPTTLLFFERGQRPASSPRNVFMGHGIAIIAGWASLALFGLLNVPHTLISGITLTRVAAIALALGLTAFIKNLCHAPHPPAGATALLISLGFYTSYFHLATMALAIVLITLFGWLLNKLFGCGMPLWGESARSS